MAFGFSNYNLMPSGATQWLAGGTNTGNVSGPVADVANQIRTTDLTDNSNWSWFGNNGVLPTAFMGLQALGGLANAYTGLQQLGLANKQYNFAKNAFNAQLGNSIENYGNAAANARRVAYALQGGYARNVFGGKSQKEAGDDYRAEVTRNMTRSV